jgi:hypothetical protein
VHNRLTSPASRVRRGEAASDPASGVDPGDVRRRVRREVRGGYAAPGEPIAGSGGAGPPHSLSRGWHTE